MLVNRYHLTPSLQPISLALLVDKGFTKSSFIIAKLKFITSLFKMQKIFINLANLLLRSCKIFLLSFLHFFALLQWTKNIQNWASSIFFKLPSVIFTDQISIQLPNTYLHQVVTELLHYRRPFFTVSTQNDRGNMNKFLLAQIIFEKIGVHHRFSCFSYSVQKSLVCEQNYFPIFQQNF